MSTALTQSTTQAVAQSGSVAPESADVDLDPDSSTTTSNVGPKDLGFSQRFHRFSKGIADSFGHLFGDPKAELMAELSEQAPDDAVLDQDTKDLVTNILNVGDRSVEDVLIARAEMVAVPLGATLEDILDLAVEKGHSRFPVFDGTLDKITGVVTVKDALKARHGNGPNTAQDLSREAIFVAPSMPIIEMLVQMRTSRDHMAFVVDEFGGIDGLITMEDLIEEIVGNIEDEHDAEAPRIEMQADGSAIADAGVSLEDAEQSLGAFLTDEEREEEIETLGGLLFTISGHIPLRGEQIQHDSGLLFLIAEASPRRVHKVVISGIES